MEGSHKHVILLSVDLFHGEGSESGGIVSKPENRIDRCGDLKDCHMSYSQSSLTGGYLEDCIGEYCRGDGGGYEEFRIDGSYMVLGSNAYQKCTCISGLGAH